MFGESESSMTSIKGVSHPYEHLSQEEGVHYTLHFVKFGALKPRQKYFYKVKSDTSAWSATFSFRAPYATGETRVASYGDMGHSQHNCMGNVYQDCLDGKIDAILHMGDHAYDMGQGGDKRGDAYMNAFSRATATCPWIPVIGNHEANDGDDMYRFMNMTFGEAGWQEGYAKFRGIQSTATSALGDFITKGTLLAAGSHGSGAPSKTSRYFSVDVGLIHFANLDLNKGTADINENTTQYKWLKHDLEKIDRSITPWVILTSHFPLYHDGVAANSEASAAWYTGEESEKYSTSGHSFLAKRCEAETGLCEQSVGEYQESIQSILDPLLHEYKVDVWNSGHVHDYSSNWPICYNKTSKASDVCLDDAGAPIKSFLRPKGTVHVTDGNGGVPGVVGTYGVSNTSCTQKWCRAHGTGGAYGRWITSDAKTLRYEHVQNADGNVSDSWEIHRA